MGEAVSFLISHCGVTGGAVGPSPWVNCLLDPSVSICQSLARAWTLSPSMGKLWFGGASIEGTALEGSGADTFNPVAEIDAVGWLDSWFLLLWKRTNMLTAGPP